MLIQRFSSVAHKIVGSDFEQPWAGPNGVKVGKARNNLHIHLRCLVLEQRLARGLFTRYRACQDPTGALTNQDQVNLSDPFRKQGEDSHVGTSSHGS